MRIPFLEFGEKMEKWDTYQFWYEIKKTLFYFRAHIVYSYSDGGAICFLQGVNEYYMENTFFYVHPKVNMVLGKLQKGKGSLKWSQTIYIYFFSSHYSLVKYIFTISFKGWSLPVSSFAVRCFCFEKPEKENKPLTWHELIRQ